MKYSKLADTGIEVSKLAFGCWAIVGGTTWGHQQESDSLDALRAAYESGVSLFDTAEAYGGGKSEQLLAKALSDVRDEIVIATKVSTSHAAPDDLRAACDGSLRNLKTEWIDLYQMHWPNRKVPFDDMLGAMEDLKAEGKIRAYGVSNFGRQDLSKCLDAGYSVASDQLAYNLLFRAAEYEILPMCVKKGISVLCYSPLMQGLLTGKFATADEVPDERARTRHFPQTRSQVRHGGDGAESETFAAIAQIRQIADELGEPMANVSLAWLLAQEGVTSVIAGGRNPDQARSNAHAADLLLSEEAVQRLSMATEPLKRKLGTNADMWQSESESRIR